jgi:hypothetical protein
MADEKCNHGVVFDEAEAKKLLGDWEAKTNLEFIMGNPARYEIRKRWPRGEFPPGKPCPKCGYVGIAYASYEHYIYGDY